MERSTEHRHGGDHRTASAAQGQGGSGHTGHDKHAGHSVEMFRTRFWVCLALTVPALIWEPMLQDWFGYQAPAVPGAAFIPAIFGTAVFVYGGWIFLQGAWRELADRIPGMMTLIGLAISVAFVYSAAVTLGFPGHALWWELATLVTIMLLGHWIEMRSIFQAQGALKELAKLLPDTALRLTDEDTPRRCRSASFATATSC
jgi:P-type Cu2+ transporter